MKYKFLGILIYMFFMLSSTVYAQLKETISKLESLNNLTYQMVLKKKEPFSDLAFSDTVRCGFDLSNNSNRFKITGTKTEERYDGDKLIKLDLDNHTYSIANSIENSIFLYESLPYIINSLKQRQEKNLPVHVKNDSLIGTKNYYHLKVTELDTVRNNKHVYRSIDILIDKESYLPVYYRIDHDGFVDGTDIFVQTYSEIYFSDYQLNRKNFPDLASVEIPSEFAMENPAGSKQILAEGTQAPGLDLKNTAGELLSLKSLKGKVVLLNFTFNSCVNCIKSIDMLNALYVKYGKQNFSVVTINPFDTKEASKLFNDKFGVKYHFLSGAETAESTIVNYHVDSYPTFYLIDKAGNIIKGFEGYGKSLDEELSLLIKKHL